MAASPLNQGVKSLPAEQVSPGNISAQLAIVLPSSSVQVAPWGTLPQLFWHSGVPCSLGCSWLLSHWREDVSAIMFLITIIQQQVPLQM